MRTGGNTFLLSWLVVIEIFPVPLAFTMRKALISVGMPVGESAVTRTSAVTVAFDVLLRFANFFTAFLLLFSFMVVGIGFLAFVVAARLVCFVTTSEAVGAFFMVIGRALLVLVVAVRGKALGFTRLGCA